MKKYIFLFLILICFFTSFTARAQTIYPVRDAVNFDSYGLVGYWPVACGSTDILDYSGRNNNLTRIQTTIVAGPSGDVFYFDGIDDYITQKVYANKIGVVTMATVASGAMLNDTGQDFSPYAGASGNTPYMVVATDTGGKVAWGYPGEEGGDDILQLTPVQIASVLEASDAADNDYFGTSVSLSSAGAILAVGAESWEGASGTNRGGVYSYSCVLPADTGVKIYSTKDGSTQSWANVESGFLPNSVASYEVRKSDFQWDSTQAFSLGAWVKPNGADEVGYVIAKYNNSTSLGWGLYWNGTSDQISFFYGDTSKASSAIFPDNNVWVHITVVYNGAGSVSFYRNGVFDNTQTGISFTDTSLPLLIGIRSGAAPPIFNGLIDSPFISSRALSASEIADLYNQVLRPI